MCSAHNWPSGLGSQALSKQVCRRVQRLRLTLTVSLSRALNGLQSNKINFVRSKSGCEQERGGGGGVSEQNLHFRRSLWCKKGLLACACPGRSGSTVMEGSHHYHQRDISSLLFFGSQLWSLDRRWKQETA